MAKLTVLLIALVALQVQSIAANLCDLPSPHDRVDCHPDGPVTKETCEARQCCWIPYEDETGRDPNEPWISWCYFSGFFTNYRVKGQVNAANKIQLILQRNTATVTGFEENVNLLMVDIESVSNDQLRVRITDPKNKRFEVPSPVLNLKKNKFYRLYEISVNDSVVRVSRKTTGVTLFNLDLKKLIYAEQYIQLTMDSLPSTTVYGMGQHVSPHEIDFSRAYKKYTFLNKEGAPRQYTSLYGTHPFYLMKEREGRPESHGVLIFNNHPSEVDLQPSGKLVYRTIGGIIDLVVFVGSEPNEVIKSKNQVIGLPNLPPFWSLGFHLCRYGYKSTGHMNETMRRNLAVGIPIEVQWADIDYMHNRNDFTIDPYNWGDLSQFVNEVHAEGRRFMPILDPAVSGSEPRGSYPPFDLGMEMDIFIKSAFDENQLAVGKVWNPETSIFPDFTNPLSDVWWSEMMLSLYKQIKFDGMWIDMNEPSNMDTNGEQMKGCPDNKLNNPQFVPGMSRGWFLWKQTICPSSQQFLGNHYDLHNMYGYFEAVRTFSAMKKINPDKRPFILSRSSATGQGALTASWTGDVDSSWEALRQSVDDLINFNLYGIPMVGADICGFTGAVNNELCARWLALGAFYPFSRAHNTIDAPDQDPAVMGQEVINAAKNALSIRYKLLPYFYTQMYLAATTGIPVVRSMALEYPSESSNNFQGKLIIGDSVLLAPALWPGQQFVNTYFPASTDWYDLKTLDKVKDHSNHYRWVDLPARIEEIPVLVKGGSIVPLHRDTKETTSRQARESTFELLVTLNKGKNATGSLFFDAGEDDLSLNRYSFVRFGLYTTRDGLSLSVYPIESGYKSPNFAVTKVVILGNDQQIKSCSQQGRGPMPCSIFGEIGKTIIEGNGTHLVDLSTSSQFVFHF